MPNVTQEQIQQVEVSLEQAKKAVALKQDVIKLENTKAFCNVVLDGYFDTEAVRLVLLKSDHEMQSPEQQEHVLRQMDAIGTFRQYLGTLVYLGNMAEKALVDDSETHAELLQEELENDDA